MFNKFGKFIKLIVLAPYTIMGGISEHSTSSQSVSKPLTAAERQDLYNSSIGSIKNTLNQSPQGYQDSTPATFNSAPNGGGAGTFQASGGSSTFNHGSIAAHEGLLGLGLTSDPTVKMPTGTADQGGIRMPTYNAPTYQQPGQAQQLTNGDFQDLRQQMTSGYTAPIDQAVDTARTNSNSGLAARGLWSSGLAEKAMGDINKDYAPQYAQAGANATNAATQAQLTQNQNVNAYNTTNAQNANNFNVTNATNQNTADWKPLEYLKSLWDATGGQTSGSTSVGQGFSIGSMGGGGV